MKDIELWHGDCLELMKNIPNGSVDAIITDPPYGTVKNIAKGSEISHGMIGKVGWDTVINTSEMLEECNRILRTNGALILFSQEPYTNHLITNAHGNIPFSYRMTWFKDHFANSLIAKKAPVNYTEDVCVFFKKYDTLAQHPLRDYSRKVIKHIGYNLKQINDDLGHRRSEHFFYVESTQFGLCTEKTYQELCELYKIDAQPWFMEYEELKEINSRFSRSFNLQEGKKYKSNVLEYRKDYTGHHPTQKPVLLMQDLVETYTNLGDTVLDFTMGSGSTGVACKNLNRKFIGIELDENYFNIAKKRING